MAGSSSDEAKMRRMEVTSGRNNTYDTAQFPTVSVTAGGGPAMLGGQKQPTFNMNGDTYIRAPEKYQKDDEDELFFKSTGGSIHNNFMRLAAPKVAAAPSGGGGGGDPAPAKSDWRDSVRPTENVVTEEGATTADILGDTYESMTQFQPQVGHLNALVDPNQWLTQVNPANQVAYTNPGVYVNPGVTGMLDEWETTSSNPYSLLG